VLNQLLTQLFNFLNNYLPEQVKITQTTVIFETIYAKLQDKAISDADRLKVLYGNYVRYAQTDQQILKLKDWILGEDPNLADRSIKDTSLLWAIVKKVFSISDEMLTRE
jgi:uncharacterized ubiquitin-like protein YukD